jgi:hypothetical protein
MAVFYLGNILGLSLWALIVFPKGFERPPFVVLALLAVGFIVMGATAFFVGVKLLVLPLGSAAGAADRLNRS